MPKPSARPSPAPTPPANGSEADGILDGELEHTTHLGLLNRGVMITPFHNMMLTSPATTSDDVQHLLHALDAVLTELTTPKP